MFDIYNGLCHRFICEVELGNDDKDCTENVHDDGPDSLDINISDTKLSLL